MSEKVKVALYNKRGKFIRAYESIAESARQLNVHKGTLSSAIKNKGLLSRKYHVRKFTDIPEKQINIEVHRRLGKELRCFRIVRGKLKFYRKFKNITLAAEFIRIPLKTFVDRLKRGANFERAGKTYMFRYVYKEDKTNRVHKYYTKEKARANRSEYTQRSIPVKLTDKDGNEFYFNSTMDAVRKFNMNRVAILHVLAGRQQRTFGFKVEKTTFEEVEKYLNEVETAKEPEKETISNSINENSKNHDTESLNTTENNFIVL